MGTTSWQALAEALPEPAWGCDGADRVVWMNRSAQERVGRRASGAEVFAALGIPSTPDEAERWRGAVRTAAAGATLDLEAAGGGWRVRVHRHADGATAVAVATAPDVQQLLDAVPWPMAWIDGSYRYRCVNRAYQSWFRRPAAGVVGRSLASLMGEEVYRAALPRLEQVRRGEPMTFASELSFPDGQRRQVEVTFLPDRPVDQGPAAGCLVLVQDVTERRREQERQSFTVLTDGLVAAYGEIDAMVDQVTRAAVGGFLDWCVVRRADGGTVAHSAIGRVDQRRLAEAGEALAPWVRAATPGDDGLVSLAGCPITARGIVLGAIVAGARRSLDQRDAQVLAETAHRIGAAIDGARADASAHAARREADRAMVELERKAAALAESNAQLEQFAYAASHDLQEPLRMVTQYLGLLERRFAPALDPKAREFIANASDGALRMQVMIRDLLAYSRAGRGEPARGEVDTALLLHDVLRDLGPQLEETGGTVTCGQLPIVVGDRTRLACVFQNLIGNALKFRGSRPPEVRVSARESAGDWEFAVVDNGIGIDPAHRHRIFEIFQRLHLRGEYPGTGMGLAICRKMVEQAGGRIWVESALGAGATFRFTLPKLAEAEPSSTCSTTIRALPSPAAASGRST